MIPLIQAKASFQDALLFIKTGMHLAPNAASAKKRIAKAIGIPESSSYGVYAFELADALRNSGEGEWAKKQIAKMDLKIRKKKSGQLEVYKPSK